MSRAGYIPNDGICLFNESHALLVRAGKDYCKPHPKCDACPLPPLPHRIEIECS